MRSEIGRSVLAQLSSNGPAEAAARHDRWLDLRPQPLDLNGPVGRSYRRFDPQWIEQPIFAAFAATAARFSGRIAVDDGTQQLTYRQVRDGACRMAQALAATAPARQPVGVLLPNDANYPIAVFGCLAAGHPCVLLDSSYPAARNTAILADAGLAALIVAPGEDAAAAAGVATVPITAAFDEAYESKPPLGGAWTPDDPALIVYTSGSTGQPKGIALAQRTFAHRCGQLIDALHLTEDDRMMPLGSPCTVAGLLQMFEALLAGATLLKLDLQRAGLGRVLDMIERKGATTLLATPALLRSLCRSDGAARRLASLRCVHAAGDVLLNVDVEEVRHHLSPSCLLLITYGATEAPAMCHWFVTPDAPAGSARVPVGYPLPDYRYALLDDDGAPVGVDEPGELVISSRYTALGEWQRGRLVPGRFTPDPADPKSRLLSTGDLVQRRGDGLITVLGRKDRLVKIRGMRVEPYEVECALRRSRDVIDAAIVARHDPDKAMLIGFVVLRPEADERALDRLRADLRLALPPYMQPTRLNRVDSLPLLPGHKVDGDKLLALDKSRIAETVRSGTAAAGSGAGAHVAAAWEQVLDRTSFDADLPFDAAGGDSLNLLMFVSELEKICDVQLPLLSFELSMRPSDMARAVAAFVRGAAAAWPAWSSSVVLLKPGAKKPPVFIAHGLGGHVGELAELARHLQCDHPIYALQLPGLGGDEVALDRIEAMARRFVDPILETERHGHYVIIGYSLGGLIAFELARQLSAIGKETNLLLLDTHPHPRFWPVNAWLRFLAARVRAQCRLIAQHRAGDIPSYAKKLVGSFVDHLRARRGLAPASRSPAWQTEMAALQGVRSGMIAAMASYRPPPYPGWIAFLQPETRQVGAPENPMTAWHGRAAGFVVWQAPGDHISMILHHARATAERIDDWITSRLPPHD